MVLDATARESNVRDSLRKYFIDNLQTKEGITCLFDQNMVPPNVNKTAPPEVIKWIYINFGFMEVSDLSNHDVDLYLCTRQDSGGFRLAQLRDTVLGYFTDTEETDTIKRIPFYRSRVGAWTEIGKLLVTKVTVGPGGEAPDKTKFKLMKIHLRWPSKV